MKTIRSAGTLSTAICQLFFQAPMARPSPCGGRDLAGPQNLDPPSKKNPAGVILVSVLFPKDVLEAK